MHFPVMTGLKLEVLLTAMRSYDAVIPSRSNCNEPREYDTHLYGERYKIEYGFGFIKHYRRVFFRFDRLALR